MAKRKTTLAIIPEEVIINKIYFLRGEKVMLDRDLAELYGVQTAVLNQAVKRNALRFPEDFMFQLNQAEFKSLISQIVISKGKGGTRKFPYAFTEQGVAMLSSVLNSPTAIEVNIRIIRVFTKMRQMLLTHKDILLKLEKLEKEVGKNSQEIAAVFEVIREMLEEKPVKRTKIGFKISGGKKSNTKKK